MQGSSVRLQGCCCGRRSANLSKRPCLPAEDRFVEPQQRPRPATASSAAVRGLLQRPSKPGSAQLAPPDALSPGPQRPGLPLLITAPFFRHFCHCIKPTPPCLSHVPVACNSCGLTLCQLSQQQRRRAIVTHASRSATKRPKTSREEKSQERLTKLWTSEPPPRPIEDGFFTAAIRWACNVEAGELRSDPPPFAPVGSTYVRIHTFH